MKKFLFFFVLFSVTALCNITAVLDTLIIIKQGDTTVIKTPYATEGGSCIPSIPSAYTTFIRLREYGNNDNPCADSLNANLVAIDTELKRQNDTTTAVKTDLYSYHNYDGTHKDQSIEWADINSAAKAMVVQVTGTQQISGSKIFVNGSLGIGTNSHLVINATTTPLYIGEIAASASRTYLTYLNATGNIDTVAMQEWVTANFEPLHSGNVGENELELSAITDSSISITYNFTALFPTAGTVANLHTINSTTAEPGDILYLTNSSGVFDIVFQDEVGTTGVDGNLSLAGDFTMGTRDVLILIYSDVLGGWLEISRSNN